MPCASCRFKCRMTGQAGTSATARPMNPSTRGHAAPHRECAGGHLDRNFLSAILYPWNMSRLARALLSLIIGSVVVVMPASAQEPSQTARVLYTLTLDQPQTQMVSVSVLIGGVEGEHIDLMLPIWRPGRYVVMNQAQSIRDFKAFGN